MFSQINHKQTKTTSVVNQKNSKEIHVTGDTRVAYQVHKKRGGKAFLSQGRQPEMEFFPFWSVLTPSRLSTSSDTHCGEQGWHRGTAGLPPMWPGFDSRTRRHMWVELVVGSHPCSERFFSGYFGFPLSSKTNISKFQFDLESEGHKFISLGLLRATLVKQRRAR